MLFLALDPAWFAGAESLKHEATQLSNYLRATPRGENVEFIMLPGDPERATFQTRSMHGIPLEPNQWQLLVDLAQKLGLSSPQAATRCPRSPFVQLNKPPLMTEACSTRRWFMDLNCKGLIQKELRNLICVLAWNAGFG